MEISCEMFEDLQSEVRQRVIILMSLYAMAKNSIAIIYISFETY